MPARCLDGQVAVVTGASAGIGLAIAKRFVAEGAYVFVTGRRPEVLDAAVAAVGENVTGVPGDAAKVADLDHGAYNASKAAVGSLARTLTAELKNRRIRVNALSPGPTESRGFERFAGDRIEELRSELAESIPVGRIGRPDEIASAALFLASTESSFVAGVELVVDGGMSQI